MFQVPILKIGVPGGISITPNTALCLILLGAVLWWKETTEGRPEGALPRRLAGFAAGLAVAIGGLSLVEFAFGVEIGIDQLIFAVAPEDAVGSVLPGLMSPIGAVDFILLGSALLLHHRLTGRWSRLIQALPYAAGIVAILGVLDFVLEPGAFHLHIAPQSALALFALSGGVLSMRPYRGLALLFSSESLGGVLARRMFPAAVIAPIVLGWLFWAGFQAGLFLPWTGIALMIAATVILLAGLTGWTAVAVHRIERDTAAQRRRSEEALRRSEKYFSALVERASDVVAVIDSDGSVRYQSPSVEGIVGWKPEELVGRNAFAMIHPDDRKEIEALFRERIAEFGATITTTYRFRHKDGSWRTVESVACNLRNDPDVGGVVVNTRDVTERKALEAQFLRAQKMEAFGQLAGGVAHDFNNVLAVILMHVDLMLSEPGMPAASRSSLADLQAAVRRASGVVRQLLVFSRREPLRFGTVNLNQVLADIFQVFRKFLGEQIQLDMVMESLPVWIEADIGMIEQVVMNLCVNARDAMPQGGRLTIRTEFTELERAAAGDNARAGRYVALVVTDTGMGMDEATQKRIFEPFFTTKEVGKGTGLGLATVYGIVNQHKGWIEVTSALGKGSSFRSISRRSRRPLRPPRPSRRRRRAGVPRRSSSSRMSRPSARRQPCTCGGRATRWWKPPTESRRCGGGMR